MSATELVEKVCKAAHEAQYALAGASAERKNEMLRAVAKAIRQGEERLLEVNKEDVKEAKASGMSFAMVDRLTLTRERIALMAEGVEQVADLPDPVGEVTREWSVPSGLHIKKVRVPLGVIGVIYESRPNVTADVAALCLKSGNCVVLRGGKDAINSNRAIHALIARALEDNMEIADCITSMCDRCASGAVWRKLYDGINAVLDSMTLQTMLDDSGAVGVCRCGHGEGAGCACDEGAACGCGAG